MIPYFVIGGPYVAGWGCAGEESRRSCNMFDKHKGMQGQNTRMLVYTRTHTRCRKPYVSVQYQSPSVFPLSHTHSLSRTFSWSLSLSASIFLPQDPLEGTTFYPENKRGTLIKFLISDPAAFRNITLSLCTVTVIVMI